MARMQCAMDARRMANVVTRTGVVQDVVVAICNDDYRRHGELESARGWPTALLHFYIAF